MERSKIIKRLELSISNWEKTGNPTYKEEFNYWIDILKGVEKYGKQSEIAQNNGP